MDVGGLGELEKEKEKVAWVHGWMGLGMGFFLGIE